MEGLTPIYVHTKGHSAGNVGAWACIVSTPTKSKTEVRRGTQDGASHNAMEIHAAIVAFEMLKRPCYVSVFTNSQYLIGGIKLLQNGTNYDTNPLQWLRLLPLIKDHEIYCCHIPKFENEGLMRQVDHEAFNMLPPDLRRGYG